MKFTPIAAATLIPATLAGLALSIMPFATGVPAAAAARPHAHVSVHAASAHPAAAAKPAPQHPATASAPQAAAPAPRAAAPAAQQPAAAPPAPAMPVMSAAEQAFEKCVAWRESSNNPTASSAGLFGILPSVWAQLGYPGTAEQASVAQQVVAFDRLYHEYGTQPWTPSDGC